MANESEMMTMAGQNEQCPNCCNLDWTDVIAQARQNGEMTPEHHPDCERVEDTVHVEGGLLEPSDLSSDALQIQIDKYKRQLEGERLELKPSGPIYYEPTGELDQLPERLTPRQITPAPQIPPSTIEELIAAMESLLEVGESTECSLAVTGEPYIMLCCGGVKQEGERIGVYCTYEEKAIELFWREVSKYQSHAVDRLPFGRDSKLYWRKKPELCTWNLLEIGSSVEGSGFTPRTLYTVTARLLISDKPPLEGVFRPGYGEEAEK